MTLMIDLHDEVMDRADPKYLNHSRTCQLVEDHECHGCGEAKPDLDLWAEDSETGEELWLCGACCEW